MHSGNEATRFTITRTLGTSILTIAVADMVISIAPQPQLQEGYEGGTSKDCTIDEPDLSQATQVRLRYKRVDFLGTANRGFRKPLTSYTHLPFCSTHLAYHKPYLRARAVLLHSSDTTPASVGFLQR